MVSCTVRSGTLLSRRSFSVGLPACVLGAPVVSACSPQADTDRYALAAADTWRLTTRDDLQDRPLREELVRVATLAPSSHNTQCWKFAIEESAITILPDLTRRCPVVDPDDHHVFVTLGCATENLVQAALAHGLHAEAGFDAARDAVRVLLSPTPARSSPLFNAIVARQCTRGEYDGQPLSAEALALLERAGSSDRVRLLLLTGRPEMERVLEYVLQTNTAQMNDPAFMDELKAWIRFNGADAARTRDGLFSQSSGNPSVPTWLGRMAFDWLVTASGENDKYSRQIRSSAGIAVFVGQAADKAHWVEVGRCYERFALQATALGIRNAFVNQPVEVAALRPRFAAALGLGAQRPDLVVRFGRGPALPVSLRRPLQSVLV